MPNQLPLSADSRKVICARFYLKHREIIAIKGRQYYLRNREIILEKQKKKRGDNPDMVALINKKRRIKRGGPEVVKFLSPEQREENKKKSAIKYMSVPANSLKARRRGKKWADNNRDSIKESYMKNRERRCFETGLWKKKNPEKVRASSALRENRLRQSVHPESCKNKMESIYAESKFLSISTGEPHEVDHIIPSARKGFHHQDNLQIIPAKLNASKQDNPFWISPSPEYKDWRDVPRELWPFDLAPKYLELIEKNKGVSIRWDTAA